MKPSLHRNVYANWANTAATILYTLVVTPIVVRSLGAEQYGVWSFLNGFLAYSDLLYLGLGASLVRYVAEYVERREFAQLRRLVSIVWTIYLGLAILAVSLCVGIGRALPGFLHLGEGADTGSLFWTTVLLGVRIGALFVGSAYSGVLMGSNRIDVALGIRIVYTVVRCAAIPLAVTSHDPLLALAAMVAVTAVLETLTLWVVAERLYPESRARLVRPRLEELHVLYAFGIKSFFVLMAVKIISYTDTTVIGIRLGPSAVAMYVLPLQLIEYGRIVVSALSSVLLPELAAAQARGSQTALRSAYLQASRVSFVLAVFLNVNLIYLGVPFLRLWIGNAYTVDAFPILLCLGIASIAQALSTQLSLPFHQATDTVGFPVAVLLLEAAVNLVLSLWLIGLLGIRGVALATLVPEVGVTFVLVPPYTCRLLRVSLHEWFRHTFPAGVVLLLALVVLHTLMNFAFASATYAGLVVKTALAGALTALIAKRMVPMTPRLWPAQASAASTI